MSSWKIPIRRPCCLEYFLWLSDYPLRVVLNEVLSYKTVFVRLSVWACSSTYEFTWVHSSISDFFFTLSWALSLFGVILALLWHFFGSRNDPFRNWRSTSFSVVLPRMVCTFVSALSVPERKQFFIIFNQASHHEKQRAKRPTKSKTSHIFSSATSFSRLPRFNGCRRIPQTVKQRSGFHTFDIVDR